MIFWWMSFPVKRPQKCPRNLPIRVKWKNGKLCIKKSYYATQKICFDDSSIRKLTGKRTDPTSNCSNWKLKIIQGFVDTVTQFYFGSWILYGIVSMLCELFVLSRSSSKLNISRHSKLLNQIRKLKKSIFLYIKL